MLEQPLVLEQALVRVLEQEKEKAQAMELVRVTVQELVLESWYQP